ncbi:MAG: hypothetical protein WBP81_32295 [Solirubrobacteraceae bacterium]
MPRDLALQAIAYGNVYVARVAMGAPQKTLRAFREAGGGLRRAVAPARLQPLHRARHRDARRAHRAAASSHWPLIRYNPMVRTADGKPVPARLAATAHRSGDYTNRELRRTLANADPAAAERLQGLAQQAVDQRWQVYEEMAPRDAHRFPADARDDR